MHHQLHYQTVPHSLCTAAPSHLSERVVTFGFAGHGTRHCGLNWTGAVLRGPHDVMAPNCRHCTDLGATMCLSAHVQDIL
jgi:hypothetical protein